MRNFLPFLFVLIVFQTLAISSSAQSKFYVATDGSDTNTGTSISAPLATIAKALTKISVPGDTIFVRSGTYTVSTTIKINKAGTSAKHYVLTVYKPDMVNANSRPILNFSGMAVSSSNRGIELSGANYWDIYGIVVKGAGDNGMNISGSSYTTIEFCSFTRNRDSGMQIGGSSHDLRIINCDSYENADLGTGTTTSGGNADGFAPKLDIGDNVLFRGCRAWLNSDDAWDGYLRTGSPGTLDNMTTYLEDCWAFRNGYYWADGSTTTEQNGNGIKMGGSDAKNEAHNFVVIRCLSFDNKAKGFDQNNSAGSLYLYNCSAFRNGGNDFGVNSSGVTYKAGAELVLKNNLSLGSKGVSIPSASTSSRTLTTSNNSFKTTVTSSEMLSLDTTGVSGMRGIDGSLPVVSFMHLNPAASTPYTYINQGTPLTTLSYHDATGVPYNGSAPDLGAFESSVGLPVSLISFSGSLENRGVLLTWKTASEQNNKGWQVERYSTNGEWTALGFVDGAGTSSAVHVYTFNDKPAVAGTYIYRLKQVDFDGNETYSNEVSVKLVLSSSDNDLKVYPNPFSTYTTVSFDLSSAADVQIQIVDVQGRKIYQGEKTRQNAGSYQKTIDTSFLTDGTYFVVVEAGNSVVAKTVIKK